MMNDKEKATKKATNDKKKVEEKPRKRNKSGKTDKKRPQAQETEKSTNKITKYLSATPPEVAKVGKQVREMDEIELMNRPDSPVIAVTPDKLRKARCPDSPVIPVTSSQKKPKCGSTAPFSQKQKGLRDFFPSGKPEIDKTGKNLYSPTDPVWSMDILSESYGSPQSTVSDKKEFDKHANRHKKALENLSKTSAPANFSSASTSTPAAKRVKDCIHSEFLFTWSPDNSQEAGGTDNSQLQSQLPESGGKKVLVSESIKVESSTASLKPKASTSKTTKAKSNNKRKSRITPKKAETPGPLSSFDKSDFAALNNSQDKGDSSQRAPAGAAGLFRERSGGSLELFNLDLGNLSGFESPLPKLRRGEPESENSQSGTGSPMRRLNSNSNPKAPGSARRGGRARRRGKGKTNLTSRLSSLANVSGHDDFPKKSRKHDNELMYSSIDPLSKEKEIDRLNREIKALGGEQGHLTEEQVNYLVRKNMSWINDIVEGTEESWRHQLFIKNNGRHKTQAEKRLMESIPYKFFNGRIHSFIGDQLDAILKSIPTASKALITRLSGKSKYMSQVLHSEIYIMLYREVNNLDNQSDAEYVMWAALDK